MLEPCFHRAMEPLVVTTGCPAGAQPLGSSRGQVTT